jgi:hypothetical protein
MAKVLTPFSETQQLLLEAGLSEPRPVQSYSSESRVAAHELAQQGLFTESLEPAGWILTPRGRIMAEILQRQGQAASGLGASS